MKRMRILGIALFLPLAVGCQTTAGQDGAIFGTALGAGLGAIIGNQTGHGTEGALIGAGAGALTGGIIGDAVGKPRERYVYQRPRPHVPPPRPQPSPDVQRGHYQTRIVTSPSGETYEERVWIPHR